MRLRITITKSLFMSAANCFYPSAQVYDANVQHFLEVDKEV